MTNETKNGDRITSVLKKFWYLNDVLKMPKRYGMKHVRLFKRVTHFKENNKIGRCTSVHHAFISIKKK